LAILSRRRRIAVPGESLVSRYNRQMAVRLIALDIDGTLLDSEWKLPEANRSAIAEATRRGIEVALVTGRRYDFAMPIARKLDAPLTMIVSNGALVRTPDGKTHLRHLLPRGTAERVLHTTLPWREGAGVVFDRPRENQLVLEVIDTDDPIRSAYYQRNKEFIGQAKPLERCLTEDPIQVMLSGKVQPMRAAEAALRAAPFVETFGVAVTTYESRDFSMIDILNPRCSKGAALEEWAAVRGFAREEVMAIGDNHNDLEMLSFAGIPVVMGNGVPELKGFGWHQTGTNDENGVAVAIEQFALREATPCA
jgi:Cof subfamily protein (haloacid dehalogenase superfamily)